MHKLLFPQNSLKPSILKNTKGARVCASHNFHVPRFFWEHKYHYQQHESNEHNNYTHADFLFLSGQALSWGNSGGPKQEDRLTQHPAFLVVLSLTQKGVDCRTVIISATRVCGRVTCSPRHSELYRHHEVSVIVFVFSLFCLSKRRHICVCLREAQSKSDRGGKASLYREGERVVHKQYEGKTERDKSQKVRRPETQFERCLALS